jgi:hypothetical protein
VAGRLSVIGRTVVLQATVENKLMAQPIQPQADDRTDERVPRTADGIGAALSLVRRMEFYRELGTSRVERVEAVLRRWWCEAMFDTDPQGERITAAALDGTLPLSTCGQAATRLEGWSRREGGGCPV